MMHTDKTLAMLADVQTQLAALGVATEMTEQQTLCGDLTAHGAVYATLHVLIAEAYFDGITDLKRARDYRDYLFETVADTAPNAQKPAYVLIVGSHDFIFSNEFAPMLCSLEFCTAVAKKLVCSLADLQTWVVNPFTTWASLGDRPELTIFYENWRNEVYAADSAERYLDSWVEHQVGLTKLVTLPAGSDVHVYRGKHEAEETLAMLGALPDPGCSRQLVNTLFRRIIGTEMALSWDADGQPGLSRAGRGNLPMFCWGNGELLVFSLCAFLALAHAKGAGPSSLVIHSISGLDTLRRLAVLDVLRDFIHATGASVWMYCAGDKAAVLHSRVGDAAERVCAAG